MYYSLTFILTIASSEDLTSLKGYREMASMAEDRRRAPSSPRWMLTCHYASLGCNYPMTSL